MPAILSSKSWTRYLKVIRVHVLLPYHYLLAVLAALIYRFPSRSLKVIMVTGTKGKSTTIEILARILEEAEYKVALANTIRIKVDDRSQPNRSKMTIQGRFFSQKFLSRALKTGCDYALIEMTSEGAGQFRHKFIELDALIFTNLTPEHIESHGSYEAYREAKLEIARQLEQSTKPNTTLVVNADSPEHAHFLKIKADQQITYSLKQLEPIELTDRGTIFTYLDQKILTKLTGQFNLYNLLAAITLARSQGIALGTIKEAIEQFGGVRGRMEPVGWQDFEVIIDYAHTPESLRQVYETYPKQRKICVLGGTGGGRDKWKRPVMGQIIAEHCDEIILTNEDPYDEEPEQILKDIAGGIKPKKYQIIMDRRAAIRRGIELAQAGDVVLITGKGTDPYIMGPRGTKTPWDDATVAHEELEKLKNA